MVATPPAATPLFEPHSLEEWLLYPLDRTEWVDNQLLYKPDMTLKHSRIQSKLSSLWRSYKDANNLEGEVYTEAPCRTTKQGRSPDVAYLTPALLTQFGEPDVFPQSFPLIAEIVSPTDLAEAIVLKAQEYLQSGSEEVWLVFPESGWVIVMTTERSQIFPTGQTVATQKVLDGFSVAVAEVIN